MNNLEALLETLEDNFVNALECKWINDPARGPYWEVWLYKEGVAYEQGRARTLSTAVRRAYRYWRIGDCDYYGVDYYKKPAAPADDSESKK